MTGLGIDRESIRAEFLAVLPDTINALGVPVLIDTDTLINEKALMETLKPGTPHVGEINRRATHQVTLLHRPGFPPRGGFSVTVGGRTFVPVGETVNQEEIDVVLTVPLVERDVFFSEVLTREAAPSVQMRIVARGALPLAVSAGLQDVQGAPVSSHVGFVEPGIKLHGGEVLTLPHGDKFTVVPPIQHDALGDTVGLSWHGDTGGLAPDPDPTPDAPGTVPTDDGWWDRP